MTKAQIRKLETIITKLEDLTGEEIKSEIKSTLCQAKSQLLSALRKGEAR